MHYSQKTAVIIPAYCPDDRLPPYVATLQEAGIGQIIVVNDGSKASSLPIFEALLPSDGLHVISYEQNQGKGVALKKGLAYVAEHCKEIQYVITADSDGQHTAVDVMRMVDSLAKGSSGVLLGSRDFASEDVPPKSRFGNRVTSVIFKLFYGVWIPDTQTGLRGFARELLPTMIGVSGDRYEYEMNVLIECATKHIPMPQLPIETVYENNNKGTHFRAIHDSARIYRVIFARFFRFIGVSLFSFLTDYGLYLFFNAFFKAYVPLFERSFSLIFFSIVSRIFWATVLARVLSGTVNFLLNRKLVFHSQSSFSKTIPRYLCLFFGIIFASSLLTSTLHLWLGWSDNIAKLPADALLFFVSYRLQQKWVFRQETPDNIKL